MYHLLASLPILPHPSRNNRPHDTPMPTRALLLPPPKPLRRIPIQQTPITLLDLKSTIIHLMNRQQESLSRATAEEVLCGRGAEREFVFA